MIQNECVVCTGNLLFKIFIVLNLELESMINTFKLDFLLFHIENILFLIGFSPGFPIKLIDK